MKGYHNSYVDKNNNIIIITEVSKAYKDIMNGRRKLYIRYDLDSVEV
jgi:hypothetical protein